MSEKEMSNWISNAPKLLVYRAYTGHLSDTSFPDGELHVVYRFQKFKQNGRLLYCS